MKGDTADMAARLRLTLPQGWFSDEASLLGAVTTGLGAAWAGLYSLLRAVRVQARLLTVSGEFLDLACRDFFGGRLARRSGEGDDALRGRLLQAMRRERATRAALIAAAAEAGYSARVFEPARPADTGAYGVPGALAWGMAGGWGSLQMPLECLVTVTAVAPVADVGPALAEALPAGGVAWVRVAG